MISRSIAFFLLLYPGIICSFGPVFDSLRLKHKPSHYSQHNSYIYPNFLSILNKKRKRDISSDPEDWYDHSSGFVSNGDGDDDDETEPFSNMIHDIVKNRIADSELDALLINFKDSIVYNSPVELLHNGTSDVDNPNFSVEGYLQDLETIFDEESSFSKFDYIGMETDIEVFDYSYIQTAENSTTFTEDMMITQPESNDSLYLDDNLNISLNSESLKLFELSNEKIDRVPLRETFSRVLVGAVSTANYRTLLSNLENIGGELKINFDDFSPFESNLCSAEVIAVYKARKVFEITQIPCIAEGTTIEILPIPRGTGLKSAHYRLDFSNTKINSLLKLLTPVSDSNRVCRLHTAMCYYDGIDDTVECGYCDVSISLADISKGMITGSSSIMSMIATLLDYWEDETYLPQGMRIPEKQNKSRINSMHCGAAMLEEYILQKALVLPNRIVDVSKFMDSYIETGLILECARDLASRFKSFRPNKIVTVATTGIAIATPIAIELQIPLVYARNERKMVMRDYFTADYTSQTLQTKKQLLIAKEHLSDSDRILIVDDFLSSGRCMDALLRIICEAGAIPVGIAVLVEKSFEKGRTYLSGYNIPVESLVSLISVDGGIIRTENQ